MGQNTTDLQEQILRLSQIGIALSSERNTPILLAKILRGAREFTRAEGGTLYERKDDHLLFAVTQNDALSARMGHGQTGRYLVNQKIPLSPGSMAGYVASTGEVLNIPDVYDLQADSRFTFNKNYDKMNDYRTRSMLLVPMRDAEGDILGVLQLINAKDEKGEVHPFDPSIQNLVLSLASQAAVALRNARLTEALKEAYYDTIFRLSVAAEFRDEDTATHIQRMSNYSALIARAMGWNAEQTEQMLYASPMHDIGKIGIRDAILLKPGKLTPEEFDEMKRHTVYGAQILSKSKEPLLQMSERIAISHHEKYDGSGYPNLVKGEDIPIEGRMVALADVFDALTTKRCYKEPWPVEKAMALIREGSGKHFDPKVVEAFEKILEDALKVRAKFQA